MTKGVYGEAKVTVQGGRVRLGTMPQLVTFLPDQAEKLAVELMRGAREARKDVEASEERAKRAILGVNVRSGTEIIR